jgi:hypothetical protein
MIDMNTSICSCMNPRRLAPALIRWALGILFLVGGVAKLTALGGFVNGYLVPAFSKTFLPSGWVAAYGYALPFVELALGVLLLIRDPVSDQERHLIALHMYRSSRTIPEDFSIRSSISPAAPTKGTPTASSSSPGASPTRTILASGLPAPNTLLVTWGMRCAQTAHWRTASCRPSSSRLLLIPVTFQSLPASADLSGSERSVRE